MLSKNLKNGLITWCLALEHVKLGSVGKRSKKVKQAHMQEKQKIEILLMFKSLLPACS